MRLAVVCEVMHPPFDEGIRIFAAELARALSRSHQLLLVSGKDGKLDSQRIHGALTDKYFLTRQLAELLHDFRPEGVVYIPWTSLTARTMVRCWALRRYAPGARLGLVALQPRPVDLISRILSMKRGPDVVMTAGPGSEDQARRLGFATVRIGTGVDLARFRPATSAQRAELKHRAGIDTGRFVVLHVGHLKETRNVGVLERIAGLDGVSCLLVTSTSTVAREDLAQRLRASGVTVMTHHQDRIEFAYRLADAYLFPVTSPLDAIEMPLSVLEAAACGIPIISTPFGGLPGLLGDDAHWVRTPDEMVASVESLARQRGDGAVPEGIRFRVEERSWRKVADALLGAFESAGGGPA